MEEKKFWKKFENIVYIKKKSKIKGIFSEKKLRVWFDLSGGNLLGSNG